jgi:hypothetical protein
MKYNLSWSTPCCSFPFSTAGTGSWIPGNIALPSERVISKPALFGGLVFAPIYIPDDDICGFGGGTDICGVYYETGTPCTARGFSVSEPIPVNHRLWIMVQT